MEADFTESQREAIHRLFRVRRDVRQGFTGAKIPQETLEKILLAAHYAPSVGFMQPWNFIVLESLEKRQKIHSLFQTAKQNERESISAEKQELYDSLKLEGILESSLNICVTCDRSRHGETGLGRSQQSNMDLFSTVCAVQNMWLAARAEDIGIGWVSIISAEALSKELNLPSHVEVVAYLCVGPVESFFEEPELEQLGWQERLDVKDLIYSETWGQK
ncbi:MAG: 5,6-dimethylbenzimidazole synthase [Lentisphaeraceae bacterium]|nr:5,6-dimethylbenzimidazole synthase [Lentisphaeraceae bacterium]